MFRFKSFLVFCFVSSIFAGGTCYIKTELDFVCKAFGIKNKDILFKKEIIDDSDTIKDEVWKNKKKEELGSSILLINKKEKELKDSIKVEISFSKVTDSVAGVVKTFNVYLIKSNVKINEKLLGKVPEDDSTKYKSTGIYMVGKDNKNSFYIKKK